MSYIEPKWVALDEICKYLNVIRDTFINWINKNNMLAHKVDRLWRFIVSEVDDDIKNDD
ncbi:MAG: excisionase family DNA-binding protein [Oscillospiraceae bacterium]